jgi:peptidyl-prolyl cis-trans isomerase B (cyclophilin B)
VPPSRRRERQVARQRYERRQARREQLSAKRRRRAQVSGAAVAVAALIGGLSYLGVALSGGPAHPPAAKPVASHGSQPPAPTPSATPAAVGSCRYARATSGRDQKFVGLPPTTGVDRTAPETMQIVTNRGTLSVRLLPSRAPCTVNSFAFLASRHYFDHTPCHRLVVKPIFVLQCGDPSGTGYGGPGYTFASENLTGARYTAGTVAMANSGGVNTNGSQFFIVYRDSPLPPNYTIFGRVTSGLPIVDRVARAGTDNSNTYGDGHPKLPVTIERLTVTQGR